MWELVLVFFVVFCFFLLWHIRALPEICYNLTSGFEKLTIWRTCLNNKINYGPHCEVLPNMPFLLPDYLAWICHCALVNQLQETDSGNHVLAL